MKQKRLGHLYRKLVGYCARCGGECYDDGEKNYHRCPRKRVEADAVIALKSACDRFRMVHDRRAWAAIIRKEDCAELVQAVEQMRTALTSAYP